VLERAAFVYDPDSEKFTLCAVRFWPTRTRTHYTFYYITQYYTNCTNVYVYIYIMYVCVCVCVRVLTENTIFFLSYLPLCRLTPGGCYNYIHHNTIQYNICCSDFLKQAAAVVSVFRVLTVNKIIYTSQCVYTALLRMM